MACAAIHRREKGESFLTRRIVASVGSLPISHWLTASSALWAAASAASLLARACAIAWLAASI